MADQREPVNKDDEISVVDLLATVIRRRAWVLWTTGLGSMVAVLGLFLLPLTGINLAGHQTLTLQATVRVIAIPGDAQASINFDIPALLQAEAANLKFTREIYRRTLLTDKQATLEKPALNRVVKQLIDKNFKVIPDNRGSTVLLTLKVNKEDQEKGTEFLNQAVGQLQLDLRNSTTKQIEQTISNLTLNTKATSELAAQTMAPFEVTSKALKGILANPDFPMSPVGEVEAMEDDPGMSKGVMLLGFFFGSSFLGLLLAFGAEALSRSRRDPATVELLKKAWKGE